MERKDPVLAKLGISEEEFSELVSRIPIVEKFPADWYDPADDEYAEELKQELLKQSERRTIIEK